MEGAWREGSGMVAWRHGHHCSGSTVAMAMATPTPSPPPAPRLSPGTPSQPNPTHTTPLHTKPHQTKHPQTSASELISKVEALPLSGLDFSSSFLLRLYV
ncbi:hypothetical protein M758_10G036000 [Ceratodon purpureus]|nr:hypothetical protein M758_10G036000 [Ceratodon purpureus]